MQKFIFKKTKVEAEASSALLYTIHIPDLETCNVDQSYRQALYLSQALNYLPHTFSL